MSDASCDRFLSVGAEQVIEGLDAEFLQRLATLVRKVGEQLLGERLEVDDDALASSASLFGRRARGRRFFPFDAGNGLQFLAPAERFPSQLILNQPYQSNLIPVVTMVGTLMEDRRNRLTRLSYVEKIFRQGRLETTIVSICRPVEIER